MCAFNPKLHPYHIVCYSGGHSSALVSIEVFRKFGPNQLILLNHNISENVEHKDIKRFKNEVANYIGVPITFANHEQFETKDQFDVCVDAGAFKVGNGTALCTNRLKTKPFEKFLNDFISDKNAIIYYGFDASEQTRIVRRSSHLANLGFKTEYPLAFWKRTIHSTKEIGIEPPNTYNVFKHANCTGCLKAGKQHWYLVYKHRRDLFEKGKKAEAEIGYSIMKKEWLYEVEPTFKKWVQLGVETTEHENAISFSARVKKLTNDNCDQEDSKPCECMF